MKGWKLEALIIAVGLFVGGKFIGDGIQSITDNTRTIEVRGLAEREVKADKVTWNINFSSSGNVLSPIYKEIKNNEKQIVEFLKSNGIQEKDIYINPPTVYDRQSDRYMSTEKGPRFNISQTITISTNNVDVVTATIKKQGELLENGIIIDTNPYNTSYEFTGLNDIKPSMIEEATKGAREAAEKFAKDSESDLGKIKTARQGQFSIEDRDQNTRYIKKVRVVTYVNYYLKD